MKNQNDIGRGLKKPFLFYSPRRKKLTKYLALSGTIFCPKRKSRSSFRGWLLAMAVCFWVVMLRVIVNENLPTDFQFWLGGQ